MKFLTKYRNLSAWTLCRCLVFLEIGVFTLVSCNQKTQNTKTDQLETTQTDTTVALKDSSTIKPVQDSVAKQVLKPVKPDYNPAPIQPTGYGAMPAYKTDKPGL